MTKCLIIGSGLVGLTTAYELIKQGHNVTIIDNSQKGQASKSAAGLLYPLSPWSNSRYMQEICISGHQEYNNFFKNLSINEQKEISIEKKNIIIFGKNLNNAKEWYKKKNFIESEYYEKKIKTIEDNIKEKFQNYLLIKNINIINPNELIKFYIKKLKNYGVIFKNENIINIYDYIDNNKNNNYDFIVIAAGSWSNQILKDSAIDLKPIKGQLLEFKTSKKLIENVILFDDYYIIPKKNNTILIGATLEDVGFKNGITEEAKEYLRKPISQIFSFNIDILDEKYTYGFRPYAGIQDPYIKKDNKNNRIIYNFGHYRYGVLTAITSAKIVSNLVD